MSVRTIEYTTEPFDGGRAFGDAGAYELLSGTAHFAFDPASAANRVITDIALAPTDGEGRVTCSADFAILRPVDPARGNRRLFFDILNRGNRIAPGAFDVTPAPRVIGEFRAGDGWLLGQGYTIAWCGWQHDVPESPHVLKLHAPEGLRDGKPISGRVTVRYEHAEGGRVQLLSHGMHIPYTVADTDEAGAVLTVRSFADDPPTVLSRARWRFATRRRDGRAERPARVPRRRFRAGPVLRDHVHRDRRAAHGHRARGDSRLRVVSPARRRGRGQSARRAGRSRVRVRRLAERRPASTDAVPRAPRG